MLFQMSDIYEFPNDSGDERASNMEEKETLAARGSWFGVANSTKHRLKVKASIEYVRKTEAGGMMQNLHFH